LIDILPVKSLGHVEVEAKFISPVTQESLSLKALIDTGATFTTLPSTISEKLKLPHITRRKVRPASGWEEMPESYVIIEILDQRTTTPVLISRNWTGP
jgi:predicted aspartyl protease